MQPKFGGRVELSLSASGVEVVQYDAQLSTPDRNFQAICRVDTGKGGIAFGDWSSDELPPEWLIDAARAILRAAWRGTQGPSPSPWPRRIHRWREAPDI